MKPDFLIAAGCCSLLAAALHLGVIMGGPSWYRFFGAGEGMAQMAEQGMMKPAVITLGISAVLALWAAYAFAGAGLLPKLPLMKLALALITAVYLLRAVAGMTLPFLVASPVFAQNSAAFWLWSSGICLVIGLLHLKGLIDAWARL